MRQGKIWGETTDFFKAATMSAHHLSIKKGGYSSQHRHEHKSNLFYVISGALEVTIWRDEIIDTTVLMPGQTSLVPPGVFHMFRGLEQTEAIEIYEVSLPELDIIRRTQGGAE